MSDPANAVGVWEALRALRESKDEQTNDNRTKNRDHWGGGRLGELATTIAALGPFRRG